MSEPLDLFHERIGKALQYIRDEYPDFYLELDELVCEYESQKGAL